MEVCRPLKSDDKLKHRPLTPYRFFRGLICLIVFLSTAFMLLAYLGPGAVLLRYLSIHYSRKATSFFFGLWLSMWPFLFEKINGTKVVFSGDNVPQKERVLIIVNHRTEVDWMYLWDLAMRKGCLGYIKYILKSSLLKLPVLGWAFHILEFISVDRKWETDETIMHQMLSTFKNPRDPLWLALFPEGTDFTEKKCMKSREYATEVGLPVLTNVLLPKTRGFCLCLETLRGSFDAVYDLTIAYKHQCPFFVDNVFGVDPSEVHIHVQRIPVNEIPTSSAEAAAWLIDRFEIKDRLLSDFKSQGHFHQQGEEEEVSTLKSLLNFGVIIALTGIFTCLTFSFRLCKIHVGLACLYLTCITHYKTLPNPILSSVKCHPCDKGEGNKDE
ncbi:putative 1-acyl-sn-glycerol-3-phosphate acyltransferase 4 [Hibiscus syriacus]|uniref:1-acylglycerol-3-phosphate O-acyltransferase n=1 Tax=Hibiscus syriacus TaxID=106335 RepID=A0A6A2YW49_HIBSY|nr:probable 1-acyl-sn-glycerol-3-phosphate acyltransferase 4 [Hibiscus syriacus]XP_039023014.1 probable 1-acyl-sn-glycerol-3-phosphate acyltransferase 4 [Hibiscus syriacus]XP_039023016.1 probable 1-acyl-sn-glycerol-3-phosphate acyltransferase 4 [Hibiscus syriacus]KAE8683636.1 putative 1-acyl-sn-glycerol-3-phosphate acyltransferase 4 [Hibiscus syriacus]